MDNPLKWKKDKENKNTVEIISKESGEKIGELEFNLSFNTPKKRD